MFKGEGITREYGAERRDERSQEPQIQLYRASEVLLPSNEISWI